MRSANSRPPQPPDAHAGGVALLSCAEGGPTRTLGRSPATLTSLPESPSTRPRTPQPERGSAAFGHRFEACPCVLGSSAGDSTEASQPLVAKLSVTRRRARSNKPALGLPTQLWARTRDCSVHQRPHPAAGVAVLLRPDASPPARTQSRLRARAWPELPRAQQRSGLPGGSPS